MSRARESSQIGVAEVLLWTFTAAPLVAAIVAAVWQDGRIARHFLGASDGPTYAANAVFVLFSLAGQLAVFLNLGVVLFESFWGATAQTQEDSARRNLKIASIVLALLWLALFLYFVLALLSLYFGLRIREASFDVAFFSSKAPFVTVALFFVFLVVDLILWKTLPKSDQGTPAPSSSTGSGASTSPEPKKSAGAPETAAPAPASNDSAFYRRCALLIDIPAVTVTLCTVFAINKLRAGALVKSVFVGSDFISGSLFVQSVEPGTLDLFLNGFEAGVATAVMVVSQVVFVVLRSGGDT